MVVVVVVTAVEIAVEMAWLGVVGSASALVA